MTTITTIYQPCYYPKLHYFSRINHSDKFIILDDVEFSRRSRQHRAEINFEKKKWMTIPVKHKGSKTLIKEAEIDNAQKWQTEHYNTLKHKYGESCEVLEPYYTNTLEDGTQFLASFTGDILRYIIAELNIDVDIYYSSQIECHNSGNPSEYLAKLTTAVSGDIYHLGRSAYSKYIEEREFRERNIDLRIQDWTPMWPDGNVCILDVLFNSSEPSNFIS